MKVSFLPYVQFGSDSYLANASNDTLEILFSLVVSQQKESNLMAPSLLRLWGHLFHSLFCLCFPPKTLTTKRRYKQKGYTKRASLHLVPVSLANCPQTWSAFGVAPQAP